MLNALPRRILRLSAALPVPAMLLISPALGQETEDPQPPEVQPAAEARSYTAADFTRFSPRTALDMLAQVPGFVLQEGDTRRGLGQASANVLINGARISGKSDLATELGRIAASDVRRIDIADASILNISGLSGQVANIILDNRSATGGTFIWRPQYRFDDDRFRWDNGELSLSGRTGRLDFSVAFANASSIEGGTGEEVVLLPDGSALDRRARLYWSDQALPKLSGSLQYQAENGAIANLNGFVQLDHFDALETTLQAEPFDDDPERRIGERRRKRSYELGGDYSFGLASGALKLIGLKRQIHTPYRQQVAHLDADGNHVRTDLFEQIADEDESILRGEYGWNDLGGTLQLSLEGALNQLDVANALFERVGAGEFEPIPLPNSAATVKEKRAEAILSYSRQLSDRLSLQSAFGAEYSNLAQSGPAGLDRTFYRPKGSLSLAWKASPRLDVSARIAREVGQLSFFDFVASGNVRDDTTNAGNANLVPQQSWVVEGEATRNLGAWGSATLELYTHFISDIVDIVPIGLTGQAPGNVDSALVYGGRWISTFNLDPIGVGGAKLSMDINVQRSRIRDPLLGTYRPITRNLRHEMAFRFRHDVPGSDLAYGAVYNRYSEAARYRLDSESRFLVSPGLLGIFLEHKDVRGITVRADFQNLLDDEQQFNRLLFDQRRDHPLTSLHNRNLYTGSTFTLSISGTI